MAHPRICSIPDCGKPRWARGYCGTHYYRWRVHGDALGGGAPRGSMAGSPQRYFREVVMTYEGNECLTWPFARSPEGYGRFGETGRSAVVSRVVCEEEHGPPPTPQHQAAHSCGNGHLACVTKRHLAWKTPKGNVADTLVHGTRNRGERCGTAKLTEPEVRAILALKGKMFQREIGAMFGVDQSHVSDIHSRKKWGWLTL